MEYNLDQVIELMRRCYRNPIDLNSLVIGSFSDLQGLLTPRAGIYQNINELVPAIDAKGEIEKLLTRIKAKYPKPYQEYESKLFVNDHYDDELVNPPKEDDNISPPKKLEPESKTPPEKTGICDILVLSANSNRKLDLDDVDPDLFRDLAEVYRKLSEKTTLYVSAKDGALKASGFLHNYRRLGFCSYDSLKNIVKDISIVEDIDTVEVSDIDLSLLGHGYYGDSQYLLEDIGQLLQHNQPSDKRNSATFNNQNYWSIRR